MKKLLHKYKRFFLSLNLDDRAIFILTIITPVFVGVFIPLRWTTGEYSLVATNSTIVLVMIGIHLLYLFGLSKVGRPVFFSFFCIIILVIVYLKGHQQLSWVYTSMAVLYFAMKPRYAFLINLVILSVICLLVYDELDTTRFLQDTFSILSLITLVFLLSETSYRRNRAAFEIARTNEIAAMNDPLTGVGNRRAFDMMLDKFADAGTDSSVTTLILMDIDYFKSINDTYGHDAGDSVLRWVASVLKSHARSGELIYRIGGEEFAVLMENTSAEDAGAFAERIRTFFEQTGLDCLNDRDARRHLTVSVGISSCKKQSKKTWYKNADRALYTAKSMGRNRVVIAESESLTKTGGIVDDKAYRVQGGKV